MGNAIVIEGQITRQLSVSGTGAHTAPLETGEYDVWCDVDVWIKTEQVTASDVTVLTGYKIFAGNVVSVRISDSARLGAIAGGAGTLNYCKVG